MTVIKDFFTSKKGWALMTGLISTTLFHLMEIPEELSFKFLGLIGSYIVGQGIADIGKHAK